MYDDEEVQTAPHSKEAEQATLGAMLLDARCIPEIAAIAPPTAYYSPVHEAIAGAIVAMNADGRPTDPIAVHDEFVRRGQSARVGGGTYLWHLMNSAPPVVTAGYHAGIVARYALRRGLISVGMRMIQMGHDENTDLDDIPDLYAAAMKDLADGLAGTPGTNIPTADELMAPTLDRVEKPAANTRVPTSIRDLDALLGGWMPGQLILIGARPSIGKSTLGLGAARHAALRCGVPTLLCTLEMSSHDVMIRLISAEAKVPLHNLVKSECTEDDWSRIAGAGNAIAGAPLYIDETPAITLGQLRHMVATLKRTADLGLVVVDYLQLMTGSKAESREQAVAGLSKGLKSLAKEFHLPVIALSQLNRQVEGRTTKIPQSSDLRESGSQEQDADVIVLMHREDAYEPETPRAGECDLIVPKNRNGPKATVTVAFQGHYARCVDMAIA